MGKRIRKPSIAIFYSYAHKDWRLQKSLHEALKPLRRSKKFRISEWYDGCIRPGREWEPAIIDRLRSSQVILLLLSPAFIDSKYCYQKELDCALTRHKDRTALVVPVLLKPVAWRDRKFSPYQAIPRGEQGAKPVTKWRPHAKAWIEIREQLKRGIQELIEGGLATDANRISRTMQDMSREEIKRISSRKKLIQKK